MSLWHASRVTLCNRPMQSRRQAAPNATFRTAQTMALEAGPVNSQVMIPVLHKKSAVHHRASVATGTGTHAMRPVPPRQYLLDNGCSLSGSLHIGCLHTRLTGSVG